MCIYRIKKLNKQILFICGRVAGATVPAGGPQTSTKHLPALTDWGILRHLTISRILVTNQISLQTINRHWFQFQFF